MFNKCTHFKSSQVALFVLANGDPFFSFFFFPHNNHIGGLFYLSIPYLLTDFFITVVKGGANFGIIQHITNILCIIYIFLGYRYHAYLFRREPKRELPGALFD